jgi:hypothetical protein
LLFRLLVTLTCCHQSHLLFLFDHLNDALDRYPSLIAKKNYPSLTPFTSLFVNWYEFECMLIVNSSCMSLHHTSSMIEDSG